jgi:hypothetical protein
VIRRLLTLAGRSGGRLSVINYGEGLAIAAAAHPLELVVNLERDQVAELAGLLQAWLTERVPAGRYAQCDQSCTTDCGHCKGQGPPGSRLASVQRLNSRQL